MNESEPIKDGKNERPIQRFGSMPTDGSSDEKKSASPFAPEPEKKDDDKPVIDDSKASAPSQDDISYFNATHDYLIRERKERNAIILKIDKIEDERIEKGGDDLDDASREIMNLQNELWQKNRLIEALAKVLMSLAH